MPPYAEYAPDQLLPALRDHLITQRLSVRKPSVAGPEYPIWLDPKRGIPYPGQVEGINAVESHPELVLALYPATGIPPSPYEGFLVKLGVQIWYRGRTSPIIQSMHEQIRSELSDRRNLNMQGLLVNQMQLTREIQRIAADERGFIYNCEYMADMWNANYVYP